MERDYYLHVAPLEERLSKISTSLATANSGIYETRALNIISNQLKILEQKEIEMFNRIFKDNPNIATPDEGLKLLQQRINEYNSRLPGIQKLNGVSLQEIIEPYADSVRISKEVEERIIMQLFQQLGFDINEIITYGAAKDKLIESLNEIFTNADLPKQVKIDIFGGTSGKKLYYQKKSKNPSTIIKNATETAVRHIAMKDLPPRVQTIIRNLAKREKWNELPEELKTKIDINDTSIILTGWYAEQTELMSGSIAALQKTSNERKQITHYIARELCNFCELPTDFYTIIFNFLSTHFDDREDFTNVFMGKNTQGITGLVGELQAALYMIYITHEKPAQSFSTGKIKWTGPEHMAGQQLHTDLIFEHYGIQVKNSGLDEDIRHIHFMDNPLQLLNEAPYNTVFTDQTLIDDIEEIYDIKAFNINMKAIHKMKSGERITTFIEPSNTPDGFNATKNYIYELVSQADRALSFLAAAAMYMDIAQETTELVVNANLLYIIAGQVYSAHQLLSDIQTKYKNNTAGSFGIDSFIKDNIVSYLNNNHAAYNGGANNSVMQGKKASKSSYHNF